ncbi:MAG: hypothetical protein ABSC42_11530 [Tepidisphaeraceae bacterium]|jgi:hypothetical protein
MTIYSIYASNGNRAGFWVQHRSWNNTCAQVQSIAGQRIGKLPGEAPLHDNAEVLVEGFDVRSGRPVKLGPRLETPQDRNYSVIAQPEWYRHRQETLCSLR